MKKSIFFTFSFFLLCIFTFGGNVPASVQKAFEQKFPAASKIKWGKENTHEYEATFVMNGAKYSANFSDVGEWLETEINIPFDQLPEKVKSTFLSEYKITHVKATARIENSKGELNFEIEYNQGPLIKENVYNNEGIIQHK